ncbi:putative RNA-binding protein EIF1AD, partial [Tremellales sp. Uapishka_1]
MGRPQPPVSSYSPSNLPSDQRLVRLGPPQGSNAFLSTDAEAIERLVEMPTKLRRVVHASRGCFAIIQLFPASAEPERLVGEIISIVSPSEMKSWKRGGEWPKSFEDEATSKAPAVEVEGSDEELPPNPNRRARPVESESESESEEEEEEDE